jgi:hypothetical protein
MTEASLILKVDSTEVGKGAKSLDDLAQAGGRAEKSTDALSRATATLANVGKMAGAVISGASISAAYLAKKTIDAADAMNDLHIKTGIALRDLAAYDLLAKQSGSNVNAMADGFKFLGNYINDNSSKLAKMGITSRDTNEAMAQFADKLASTKDQATRTSMAMEVLGRSGVDLLPTLLGGSAAFNKARADTKAYGDQLEKLAPQADALNDKLAELSLQSTILTTALTLKLVPGLTDTATKMNELLAAGKPLKALWEGLAGMAKVPWDLFFPPAIDVSYNSKLIELKAKLNTLEAERKGIYIDAFGGRGSSAVEKDMQIVKNQISATEGLIKKEKEKADSDTKSAQKSQHEAAKEAERTAKAMANADNIAKQKKAFSEEQDKATNDSLVNRINADVQYAIDMQANSNDMKAMFIKDEKEKADVAGKLSKSQIDYQVKEFTAGMDQMMKDHEEAQKVIAKQTEDRAKAEQAMIAQMSNNIADVMYSSLTGAFVDIGQMFKNMLTRFAVDAAAQKIVLGVSTSLFGTAASAAGGAVGEGMLGSGGVGAFMAGAGGMALAGAGAAYILGKYGFGIGNTAEKVGGRYMTGTVGTGGINAQNAQNMQKDGGWFGGGMSSWTEFSAVTEAQTNRLAFETKNLNDVYVAYGKAIGDNTIATKSYTADIQNLADSMGSQLAPSLEKLRMEGESLADTARRVTSAIAQINGVYQDQAIVAYRAAVADRDALKQSAISIREFISTLSGNNATHGNFASINALAARGDTAAQGKLQGAATGYLDAAKASARSSSDYARAMAFVQSSLSATASSIERQVKVKDDAIVLAENGNSYLKDISANTKNTTDAILALNQTTAAAAAVKELTAAATKAGIAVTPDLITTSKNKMDGGGAVAAIKTDYGVLSASSSGGVTSSVSGLAEYQQTQAGRLAKSNALAALNAEIASKRPPYEAPDGGSYTRSLAKKQYDAGADAWAKEEAARISAARAYYDSLPSYAVGTNALTSDGLFVGHKDEEIKPGVFVDKDQRAREQTNELLAKLQKEVEMLRNENRDGQTAIAINTSKTAKTLQKFDGQGLPDTRVV